MSQKRPVPSSTRRRTLIGTAGAFGIGGLAGCLGILEDGSDVGEEPRTEDDERQSQPAYEIWALDQGTDVGYVYEPTSEGFVQRAAIDFASAVNEGDHDHGHQHDHGHDHELGDPTSTVAVSMETHEDGTHHFVPHVVHIEVGGTVRWVNDSGSHDTTAYHPDTFGEIRRIPSNTEPWESGLLNEPGETFEQTFETEGVYDYVCTPHEGGGMVGTVVVGWPDPEDQPGLEPVAADRPASAKEGMERYNDRVRQLLEAGEDYEPDGHDHDHGGLAPHMIDFSADFAYAVVALHHGDGIAIVRTHDREVVASVPTGGHSHFAGFAPDDNYITVDVVDDNAVKKVAADLETEEFEIVEEIVIADEAGEEFVDRDPTCHYFTGTGYTYHTLGPSYHDGGLAIVDQENFELVEAYTIEEVAANCGVFPHPTQDVVYLTAGLPSDPETGKAGIGEYFVIDAHTHEVIHNDATRGVDAHGLWITPDGEELWITNRETNDGVIVDTDSHEIVEKIDRFGPETGEAPEKSDAPDILAASPDGEYMFATARGPNPVTADPQASTGVTPGVFVIDVESRQHIDTIRPDPNDPESDFHGIGVRPLGEFDGYVGPSV